MAHQEKELKILTGSSVCTTMKASPNTFKMKTNLKRKMHAKFGPIRSFIYLHGVFNKALKVSQLANPVQI